MENVITLSNDFLKGAFWYKPKNHKIVNTK